MKADLSKMKPVSLADQGPGKDLAAPAYLFLPRNQRMVLLRAAGAPLGEALYRALIEKGVTELWFPPAHPGAEVLPVAAAITDEPRESFLSALEKHGDPFAEPAGALRFREQADSHFRAGESRDPLLAQVLDSRAGRNPLEHSVVVGSLSVALAIAAGQSDPTLLSEILVAANFHDVGFALAPEDHGAAGVALLNESELALPEAALAAIVRHHQAGPHPANSPVRYLSLAERFTEFQSAEPGLPMRELFRKFALQLPPEDAALFGA